MFHHRWVQINNNQKAERCTTAKWYAGVCGSSHWPFNLWMWSRCTEKRRCSPEHMKLPFRVKVHGRFLETEGRDAKVQDTFHRRYSSPAPTKKAGTTLSEYHVHDVLRTLDPSGHYQKYKTTICKRAIHTVNYKRCTEYIHPWKKYLSSPQNQILH